MNDQNRLNNSELVKKAGYDMQLSSQKVRDVYIGKMDYE